MTKLSQILSPQGQPVKQRVLREALIIRDDTKPTNVYVFAYLPQYSISYHYNGLIYQHPIEEQFYNGCELIDFILFESLEELKRHLSSLSGMEYVSPL
jgi:hypothetical protein